ncbi:alpha-keto acid decarboxylase family protein [Morganella psychrotolerans]|uniref:alpha-keto acid decarboxylase family protein n=1 Tax=Morganella psychrotolerans TaxID=368603 RepID=UPI0039AF7031
MIKTVIEHVLGRLQDLGIHHVFGVAGDYAFPVEDAVCESNTMKWIGNCNELNAAYAADGYARINGMAALSTTFGVGELSAINGIAGAYAENLPVFHLVGMPASGVQKSGRLVHHTLGDGNFSLFYELGQRLSCAHTIMTPDNCVQETERLITSALRERRPVYIGFPSDYAVLPVKIPENVSPQALPVSNSDSLSAAVAAISAKLAAGKSTCILPGMLSARSGLIEDVRALISKTGLPYATMFMDKAIISESNPHYTGMYDGKLMNPQVREFVENCECILSVGAVMTDFNTGSFTAEIAPQKLISIFADNVSVGAAVFHDVYMRDILPALIAALPHTDCPVPPATGLGLPESDATGEIIPQYLYPRFEQMFRENDIIIAETGTVSMGLGFTLLPEGAQFHNQTLWGSIGWATPAAFGAAVAAPDKRIILITGEGAHQLTAQEISQFDRAGLKPLIFVLNNDGYLIERLLCKDPEAVYNDLPQWRYAQLPEALGCDDWYCRRVTTCTELDKAIKEAESGNRAAYIEIITDRYAASELAEKLGESAASLYSF